MSISGPRRESVPRKDPPDPERVLIVTPTGRDAEVVRDVLARASIDSTPCLFQAMLLGLKEPSTGALIVAEEALLMGAAAQLARALSQQPAWSDLPLIVLLARRRAGSANPLVAALGVDGMPLLLERPLRKSSLVSVVKMALRSRRRQYEVRDYINEQARFSEQLEQANRRKDQFLAMLAHELRNPLGPIRNAPFLLQHFAPTDPNLMKIGAMVGRQSAHMTRLLDDLLDVSRITRGKITLRREPVDTAAIAGGALEIARPVMELRRHEVRLNFPSKCLWVQGDATRLTQVLGNLLINAGKYTPAAGEITLTLEGTTEHVIYRVRDNGVGIEAELLSRVFDLFSQAETSLERTEGGLGIGLAVVKSIVEMHGGSVAALSEGQGKGAEFIIRLPRLEYVEVEQEKAREQSVLPSAPQRVLVADDNSDLAESVAMLLRFEGHEVRIAHDGPSALELAEEFKPDAALLDIGLPGLNGYELARKLRSRSSGQKLLLIAVTGYGQFEDRERSKNAGFDCHLVKPVDPHALSALLKKSSHRLTVPPPA